MEADENIHRLIEPHGVSERKPGSGGDIGQPLGEANPGTRETLAQVAQKGGRSPWRHSRTSWVGL